MMAANLSSHQTSHMKNTRAVRWCSLTLCRQNQCRGITLHATKEDGQWPQNNDAF